MSIPKLSISGIMLVCAVVSCASESQRTIEPQKVAAASTPFAGPKYNVVLGAIENKSAYMNGIFAEGPDRLATQARQMLKTHLSQSGRFVVLDRVNLDGLLLESEISGQAQKLMAGSLLITGAVTEFGRRVVGERGLGGVLYRSKRQVAYCKVALSIVDVSTSEVLLSTQGAGEYQLSNAEVVGFGSHAGYDATLNDKVLNLAMIEAINRIAEAVDKGEWKQ